MTPTEREATALIRELRGYLPFLVWLMTVNLIMSLVIVLVLALR